MSIVIILLTVLQSIGVALGVGSSTLAISNFFAAIADGTIDETERRMMGIVYIVLRVAMGIILITTILLTFIGYLQNGLSTFTPHMLSVWTLLFVLYVNAFLMTKHLVPTTIGPALQAASWYTFGTIMSLLEVDIYTERYGIFLLSYITTIFFAIAFINGIMVYLKYHKK